MMRDPEIIWTWIARFIVAGVIVILLSILIAQTEAAPLPGRYLLEFQHYLLWSRVETLEIVPIADMCHSQQVGWCDDALISGTQERVLLRIVDFQQDRSAVVLSKRYQGETICWWWWWQPYRDATGNPHPYVAQWIDCDSVPEYNR